MVVNRKHLADMEWMEWTNKDPSIPVAPYDKGEVFLMDRPDDSLCLFAACERGELQVTLMSKGAGFENRITFPLSRDEMKSFGKYIAMCYANHQSDFAKQVEDEGVREMDEKNAALDKGEEI